MRTSALKTKEASSNKTANGKGSVNNKKGTTVKGAATAKDGKETKESADAAKKSAPSPSTKSGPAGPAKKAGPGATTTTTAPKAAAGPKTSTSRPGSSSTKAAKASLPEETPKKEDTSSLPTNQSLYPPIYETRLHLARGYSKKLTQYEDAHPKTTVQSDPTMKKILDQCISTYESAIGLSKESQDPYIELGALLERRVSVTAAANLYASYPFPKLELSNTTASIAPMRSDDVYIYSELARTFMKEKRFKEPLLVDALVVEGRANGMASLSKYVETLDKAAETKVLMAVYAGVNRKSIDDKDLVAFFKSKFWM
jgi:hypothetical protein